MSFLANAHEKQLPIQKQQFLLSNALFDFENTMTPNPRVSSYNLYFKLQQLLLVSKIIYFRESIDRSR